MTDFTILKGGAPGKTGNSDKETIEKFRMFLFHCRQIEQAISIVHQMSKGFNWKELEIRCEKQKTELRDMLIYVKKSYKGKLNNKKNKPKLELLVNKLENVENEIGEIIKNMDI